MPGKVKLDVKAVAGANRWPIEQVLEPPVAFGEARALGNGRFTA